MWVPSGVGFAVARAAVAARSGSAAFVSGLMSSLMRADLLGQSQSPTDDFVRLTKLQLQGLHTQVSSVLFPES